MKQLRTIASLRRWRGSLPPGAPVILVPTMGALHEGHLALVRHARKVAGPGGAVVASVFVNPAQFGPKEDLSRYPRPLARDLALLRAEGAGAAFLPADAMMYAADHTTWIDESALSTGLCGASRPGHFRGVCTVVAKLFNCVQPTAAVFGEKDFQQLAIIRRMTRDLDFPVRIIGRPTVREADGLALSSRNAYLSAPERAQAPALHRALKAAAAAAHTSPAHPATLIRLVKNRLAADAPLARVDYIEVVNACTLARCPASEPVTHGSRLLAAAWFGRTRLIDNVPV